MTTDGAGPIPDVWRRVSDIWSHTGWMQDAAAIRFTFATTADLGTTFDCDKRGPLSLTDRMVVTEWQEGKAIGIRHRGLVTGTGRFTLTELGRVTQDSCGMKHCGFRGGSVARSWASLPCACLRRVSRGNLARLRDLIERPH